MNRGRMKYLPAYVLDELEQIKQEQRVNKDNLALFEMVKYSKVGRELDRIRRLDFSKPILGIPKKVQKKYGKR